MASATESHIKMSHNEYLKRLNAVKSQLQDANDTRLKYINEAIDVLQAEIVRLKAILKNLYVQQQQVLENMETFHRLKSE